MTDLVEHVIPVDIGCWPSLSGSGEVIIQTEDLTFVVFQANLTTASESGRYEGSRRAVVECVNCSLTKYGYPNDEGLLEHPLYSKGLSETIGVGEVINSTWMRMLEEQMDTSARRIHGNQYYKAYNVPPAGERIWNWKHFIFTFKEGTFECIAHDLRVTLTSKSYEEILSDISQRILDD